MTLDTVWTWMLRGFNQRYTGPNYSYRYTNLITAFFKELSDPSVSCES